MIPIAAHRMAAMLSVWCLALAALSGCATLPTTGPTGGAVTHGSTRGGFRLVEVDAAQKVPQTIALSQFTSLPPRLESQLEMLSPGDVITVTAYEVGVRLFAGTRTGPAGETTFDPSAQAEKIGPLEIDRNGSITLPYIGPLQAAGRTPAQLEALIEGRLRGKSENPQVLVTVDSANGSSVYVSGEVEKPGRIRLSSAHEKLLDVITLAGGYRGTISDLLVNINRQGNVSEGPVDGLTYANTGGIPMEPGDRVVLLRRPRTYSVLGTANRANQYNLPTRQISLIEALALAGGPNENLADPAAVFVFRYSQDPDGKEVPVAYHVNMMKPTSYFLAQKFAVDDKDVIYLAGAEANRPTKLLQIIGQAFTPAILLRQATQ